MKHKTKVLFRVTGEYLDPEALSLVFNLSPTKIWHKGDLVTNKTTHLHKEGGWELKIEKLGDGFTELLNIIIKSLYSIRDKIKEVAQHFFIELQCVVHIYNSCDDNIPSIHIENWQLKFFSEIGADIDVDIIWSD